MMPSIAQIPVSSPITSSPPGGKKRKREQFTFGDGEDYTKLSSIQRISPPPRSHTLSTTSPLETASTPQALLAPRLVLKPRSQKPLRPHDAKRQKVTTSEPTKQNLSSTPQYEVYNPIHMQAQAHNDPTAARNSTDGEVREAYTRTDLSPCHICHQKPKVRTDLDSYADCEGCGRRTCYICMRECLGPASPGAWERGRLESEVGRDEMSFTTHSLSEAEAKSRSGEEDSGFGTGVAQVLDREYLGWPSEDTKGWEHKGMVCSQCCVERGADGEVRCFGCLRAEEAG